MHYLANIMIPRKIKAALVGSEPIKVIIMVIYLIHLRGMMIHAKYMDESIPSVPWGAYNSVSHQTMAFSYINRIFHSYLQRELKTQIHHAGVLKHGIRRELTLLSREGSPSSQLLGGAEQAHAIFVLPL